MRAFVIERRLVFTHEAFKQKLVRLFKKKKGGKFAEKENVRSGKAAIVAFFFFFFLMNQHGGGVAAFTTPFSFAISHVCASLLALWPAKLNRCLVWISCALSI